MDILKYYIKYFKELKVIKLKINLRNFIKKYMNY